MTSAASPSRLPSDEQVDAAVELLRGRHLAVLTGAGISTDSGIPDYRGEGAPQRTPMTFAQFLSDPTYRQRYWAGSHLGWRSFGLAHPNTTHRILAEWEQAGRVSGVVTQNVDGLHRRAGSARLVELHGAMDQVGCLACGQRFAREAIAARMVADNPWLDELHATEIAPDGDAVPTEVARFVVPECSVCGGMLKPDVVFFGEFVPTERFAEARSIVEGAEALLIAGSSLAVNSGVRLLEVARRRGMPVLIVNVGATKGDAKATLKIDAGAAETLTALAAGLEDAE